MAVNGRRKGSNYERKIAEILGKAFGMKFKRTPMSGGWSKETVQGDIVPVGEKTFFALSLECKTYKTFPKQVLLWLCQAINDVRGTVKLPAVIFHIMPTTNNTKIKLSKTVELTNPFPRGEEFIIMRLDDFLTVADKEKIKDESLWSKSYSTSATFGQESQGNQCNQRSKKAKSSSSTSGVKRTRKGK